MRGRRALRAGVLCALPLLLSLAATPAAARDLVVGLYDNRPKVFRGEGGEPKGIFVDLLAAIAAEEGWTPRYRDCQWSQCLVLLESGGIDLMPDVAYSPARARRFDFHTIPALHSWSQVYRRPGTRVVSLLDLDGKRVALLQGSIQEADFRTLMREFGIEFTAVPTGTFAEAMRRVRDGRADAAVVNHFFGNRNRERFGLVKTPIVLQPSRLFFAAPRGRHADLLAAIDDRLARWEADSGSPYYAILEKWMTRPRLVVPRYVWLGVGAAGVLLALAVGVALLLRWQVRARTRHLEQANAALQETHEALETAYQVVDASPVVLFRWRPEPGWPVAYVSGNVRRWGYTPHQLMSGAIRYAGIIHPDDLARIGQEVERRLAQGAAEFGQEYRVRLADGAVRWVKDLTTVTRGPEGRVTCLQGAVTDITERKETEHRLEEAATVIDNTLEGVVITGCDHAIRMVNRAFTAVTGYGEAEVLGAPVTLLDADRDDGHTWQGVEAGLAAEGTWQGELHSRRKGGEVYPELRTISAVQGADGGVDGYVHVFTDMSRLRATEARLDHLASHDALTGLPNRKLLLRDLRDAIDTADAPRLALLMLDLDRFKDVNESFGHQAGDELLRRVAGRLEVLSDGGFLAHLGADQFALVINGLESDIEAARRAEAIIAALDGPQDLGEGIQVRLSTTVGISLCPSHGDVPETLLQQADAALYRAKAEGGGFRFFDESLTRSARRRIEMESRLRQAIDGGELRVHFQPQVEIETGRIVGAEALVRWMDPERGLISPADFIPAAERTGLILPLGEWVLRETCRQGREWLAAGRFVPRLAVNLSAAQLRNTALPQQVAAILEETGYSADGLELELTESTLMAEHAPASATLAALKALGLHLAIDDFGTGYSSLAYLKRFPIDVLKIDKGFVSDIPRDRDDREIANAIIAMGHALGQRVLAEGVETREQLEFLRDSGCDLYQGYIMSPPLPAAEFQAFVERGGAGG